MIDSLKMEHHHYIPGYSHSESIMRKKWMSRGEQFRKQTHTQEKYTARTEWP